MKTKNQSKGASFTYAFRRINESIESGYYLEAVTLAESIISDRLLSFVKIHDKSASVRTPFKKLINSAKKFNKTLIQTKNGVDIFVAVDAWRVKRNECIHSISKSEPGEETTPVDVFLEMSDACAKDGKLLARLFCVWDKTHR